MAEKHNKKITANTIPPLSQQEREHLTYLKVLNEYHEAKDKRNRYQRICSVFIIVSALVFLALIFSLESKIEFMCLWIIVVIYCVIVMVRADYRYHFYKEILEFPDETDDDENDTENRIAEPPQNIKKNLSTSSENAGTIPTEPVPDIKLSENTSEKEK